MAIRQGKKVTELTTLNSASLNTYVVGVDNNVTYKISLDVLEDAVVKIFSSSADSRLDAIESYTASADPILLNAFTSSADSRLDNIEQSTSSFFSEKQTNPAQENFVALFGQGKTLQKSPIFVTGSRVIVGGPSASVHPFNPEAFAVYSQLDGYNLISGHGETNNYLQLNIKNFSNLSNASSDVVATADNGTEDSYYVNMGINGSGYDEDTIIGLANDTYVYGYGNAFHIGNASEEPVYIFAGGFDARGEHLKMIIDPNNNHTLTGSLDISGSLAVLGNQYISGSIELHDISNIWDSPTLLQKNSDGTFSISNGRLVPADGIRIPGGQNQIILKNDTYEEYDTNIQNIDGIGLQISASGTNNAILEIIGHSLYLQNTFTASINEGYIWVGGYNNKTYLISTSSFASTGSNTFIGKQVLQDDSTNSSTLYPYSGSLILIGHSYNSASNHLSASSNGFINLIFKDTNTEGSTIISGSNNIIKNPNNPTTGFVNYIKDGNISLQGHIPQMSSSMQFPIDLNGNILNGHSNVIMRGPSSATYWTINGNYVAGSTNGISIGTSTINNAEKLIGQLTISNNVIQNALQIIANNRPIEGATMISSNNILGTNTLNLYGDAALLYTQNYNNGTNQFTTNYSSGSTTSTIISATRNTFAGNNNNVTITGSYVTGSTTLSVVDNATFGASNTLYINADTQLEYKDYLRTIAAGSNLIVSGSNWASDTNNAGTIVLGRNNVNDGVRNKTRENILIVGTGTSTTNRKTGLLIDSGSNMFVEGTFNVSGSSNFNGGITGSIDYSNLVNVPSLISSSAQITTFGFVSSSQTIDTASFATTGSNTFNGNQTITGSLIVSGSTTLNVPVLYVGTGSGAEGGEIQLAYAQSGNTTLTGSNLIFDVYGDKVRIFEGGGNYRGVSFDISKMGFWNNTEFLTKASGIVNRGVDVTLGNLKVRFPSTGNMSLQVSTISGTYSVYGSGIYTQAGSTVGSTIDGSSPLSVTTTPAYLNSGYNFGTAGATDTWVIMDTSNTIAWRITMIIGAGYNNNLITIERLH